MGVYIIEVYYASMGLYIYYTTYTHMSIMPYDPDWACTRRCCVGVQPRQCLQVRGGDRSEVLAIQALNFQTSSHLQEEGRGKKPPHLISTQSFLSPKYVYTHRYEIIFRNCNWCSLLAIFVS